MKKEKQPAIYEIVQSMDRAERGYFVKFAGMLGKGGNYIAIFGILSEMEQFEKEKLFAKLKKKKIHTSNLTVTLHHLYALVLKSLRLFHEKNYYKTKINNIIAEAEILLDKNLKNHAIKLLDKAESLAEEHHFLTALIEIQKIKIVQKVAVTKKNLMEEIQMAYQELEKNTNTLQEEILFRKLHHIAMACHRINNLDASFKYKKEIQNLMDHPSLNDDYRATSFYAKYYKEGVKGIKGLIYVDRTSAHQYYKKIIQIWNEYPTMIKTEPLLYRNVISNYLANAIFIKKVDDFEEQILQLENIPTRFDSDKIELFQSKIYLKQSYFLNYKKLDNAYQLIEKNSILIEKYKNKMNFSRLTIIQYNFLIICFLKGEFNRGVFWLKKIIYEKNVDPKKDVRLFCRIIELILHFEMDNYDLLDSLIGSVWRKRKADSSFYEYSESIIKHFKSLMKTISKNEVQTLSKEFMGILEEFSGQSPRPIGIEELIFWTKSKIENTTIEEAYMNSDF